MELLTDSFEEKPRKAPVPESFTGNPVFTSVPEVSLVFSTPPSKNVESIRSDSSNELITTNLPRKEKRDPVSSPHNILTKISCSSADKYMSKIPNNNCIEVPAFKSTSTNESKFLASVGVMADKILEENIPLSQQSQQLNRCHRSATDRDDCRRDGASVLMDLQSSNNHRYPFPKSHQYFPEVAEKGDSNCPGRSAVQRNCHYENSVERETEGYQEGNNCNIQTNNLYGDKIPVLHCSNMIHSKRNAERKPCFCAENIPHFVGATYNVQNKIASDCYQCSLNRSQGFCNFLYEKNRPCCCAKPAVQVCNSALQHANNLNTLVPVPPTSSLPKGTITESLQDIYHCRNNSSHDTCRNVHNVSGNQMQLGTINKKTDDFTNLFCTSKPSACDENMKSGRAMAHQKNSRESNTVMKLNSLETVEEKSKEELVNDSLKKGVVEREESDGVAANTTLLQEIVEINQKQCSFIQGLLQQVVALQADQMKILGQISEKINNVLTLDESSKKCADVSKISSVKNATTQTNVIEYPDVQNRHCPTGKDKTLTSDKVCKNLEVDKCACKCAETDFLSKTVSSSEQHEVVNAPEKEPNRGRKLQDRAVSWSAVHGVETVEESFTLHGVCVPTVVEQMPSSIHTMHLHMQDYHSSASLESVCDKTVSESKSTDSSLDNRGSWTLYDNIVGHVKKFLHSVPCDKSAPNAQQKSSQVEAIRFATIEKIRQLGVSVYENSTEIKEVNTTGRIHFDSKVAHCPSIQYSPQGEHNSSDASLEIQTLALKYLPEDDLYDIAKLNFGKRNLSSKAGQKSVNVSIATQNYLEKYNLVPSCSEDKSKLQIFSNQNPIGIGNNILDITTLKKQPKLL